jgi:hypothetical protein
MAWITSGTVALTNGSPIVVGTGTTWLNKAGASDVFIDPNGVLYEILSVQSGTQLTLASNYAGTTNPTATYRIFPTQSYNLQVATAANNLIATFQAQLESQLTADVLNGKFTAGTAALPGIAFTTATGTGFSLSGTGAIVVSTTGAEALRVSAAKNVSIGLGTDATRKLEIADTTRAIAKLNATVTTGTDAQAGVEFSSYDGVSNTVGASILHNYSLQATDPNYLKINTARNAGVTISTNNAERFRIDGSGITTIGGAVSSFPWAGNSVDVRNSMRVFDASSSAYGLRTGFTANVPYLQSYRESVGVNNLQLQPLGGNVSIGSTTSDVKLRINGTNVASKGQLLIDSTDVAHISMYNGATRKAGLFVDTSGTTTGDLTLANYVSAGNLTLATNGTERFRIDASGNIGLGVTPSAWSGTTAFEMAGVSVSSPNSTIYRIAQNTFFNGTNWVYKTTGAATRVEQGAGATAWYTAPSGTTGTTATFTQVMWLSANGDLAVGGTPAAWANGSRAIEIQGSAISANGPNNLNLTTNVNGAGVDGASNGGTYISANPAARYKQVSGTHSWQVAPTGTVGAAIGFTTAMTLANSGNLSLGSSAASSRLNIGGTGEIMRVDTTTARGSGANYVSLYDPTGRKGYWGYGAANDSMYVYNELAGSLILGTANVSRMVIDSTGNIGLGVTPSSWTNSYTVLESQSGFVGGNDANGYIMGQNVYVNTGNWVYKSTNAATQVTQSAGTFRWFTAPSGTAGTTATFTERMRLDVNGNLLIGTTSLIGSEKVNVNGLVRSHSTTGEAFTASRDAIPAAATSIGTIGFEARGDVSTYLQGANIQAIGEATWTATSAPAYLSLRTTSTGATTPTEKLRLTADGRLGVGTTPNAAVRAEFAETGTASATSFRLSNTTDTSYGQINYVGSTFATVDRRNNMELVTNSASSGITFLPGTASAVAGHFTPNGHLILGKKTSTPVNVSGSFSAAVQVHSADAGNHIGYSAFRYSANGAAAPVFVFAKSASSTFDTNAAVGLGAYLGYISFTGADGTQYDEAARITGQVDATGTVSATSMPGALLFWTTANGSTSPTERMRIDSAGKIGVGVAPSPWSTGATWNSIDIGSGAIANAANSDLRLYSNAYVNSGGSVIYKLTAATAAYTLTNGAHTWYSAASGTAGTTVTYTQVMDLSAAGNLTVGNIVTNNRLTVSATGASGVFNDGTPTLRLNTTAAATVGLGPSIIFSGQTGNATATYGFAAIQAVKASATAADYSGDMLFYTQPSGGAGAMSERMRIVSAGNVGVGTSAPNGRIEARLDTSGTANLLVLRNNNPTAGYVSRLVFGGYRNTDVNAELASVDMVSAAGTTNGQLAHGGYLIFRTTPDSATTPTERLRVDASGISVQGSGSVSTNLVVGNDLQAASFNSGHAAGNRNVIINGSMTLDQRFLGVAGAIAAGIPGYTTDRFYLGTTGTGSTATYQNMAATITEAFRQLRITGGAGVTTAFIAQRIESLNCAHLAGKNATISLVTANSLLTTVTWNAYYANTQDGFGTLTTPTRTAIASGSWTVNGTMTRYQATFAVPAAAKNGIEIVFSVGAQTSGTWDVTNVQLEHGTVATPFERVSPDVLVRQCERYFERTGIRIVGYATGAGAHPAPSTPYRTAKRVNPTVAIQSTTSLANASTVTFNSTTGEAAHWDITALAAGPCYGTIVFVASAEL